jgi:hypothetical protein
MTTAEKPIGQFLHQDVFGELNIIFKKPKV